MTIFLACYVTGAIVCPLSAYAAAPDDLPPLWLFALAALVWPAFLAYGLFTAPVIPDVN